MLMVASPQMTVAQDRHIQTARVLFAHMQRYQTVVCLPMQWPTGVLKGFPRRNSILLDNKQVSPWDDNDDT